MRGYTSKTAVENYTLQSINVSFASQIEDWIESIEKYIEKHTGRVFIADATASERVYDGEGSAEQKFDDFVEVTKVELNEDDPNLSPSSSNRTEIISANYRVYPNNQENKHTIQLKYDYFSNGYQNVHITAKWGYSVACPADITLAATILLAGVINYANDAKGKVRSESIGRYSVSYASAQDWQDFEKVKDILNSYRKFTF